MPATNDLPELSSSVSVLSQRHVPSQEHRDEVLPWIKEYSPIEHVTADDPAIYMSYTSAPALGQEQKDPTHTANYGVKLQEKCKSVGVECELVYPGAPDVKHATVQSYLVERLKAPKQ